MFFFAQTGSQINPRDGSMNISSRLPSLLQLSRCICIHHHSVIRQIFNEPRALQRAKFKDSNSLPITNNNPREREYIAKSLLLATTRAERIFKIPGDPDTSLIKSSCAFDMLLFTDAKSSPSSGTWRRWLLHSAHARRSSFRHYLNRVNLLNGFAPARATPRIYTYTHARRIGIEFPTATHERMTRYITRRVTSSIN